MSIIKFDKVDVIFSKDPREALKLLDEGLTRDQILKKTRTDRRRRKRQSGHRKRRNLRPDGPVGLRQIQPIALYQRPQHRQPWLTVRRA